MLVDSNKTTKVVLSELNEIAKDLDGNLEIYRLFSEIKDEETRQFANEAIAECIGKLQEYKNGFIPMELHNRQTKRISKCSNSVKAVFWAQDIQELFKFTEDNASKNYYKANVEACIDRKVKVKRIFVFDKKDVLDDTGLFVNEKAISVLSMHKDDGLITDITWIDDWNTIRGGGNLFRDFVIFDDREVMTQPYDGGNNPRASILVKNEIRVEEYKKFFHTLETVTQPFDEIVANRTSRSS